MARIVMEAGSLVVEVDPDLGGSITNFMIEGPGGMKVPILRPTPMGVRTPGACGSFAMGPWANRVADAAFDFGGAKHELRVSSPDGSAIHGDLRGRPWKIADRTPVSARLVFDSREHDKVNFPFAFGCVQRVELAPEWLQLDLSVTNLGDEPMPCGCGHHPYFMRRLWASDDRVEVRAEVGGRYPVVRNIPTGAAVDDAVCAQLSGGGALGDPGLDDCFNGFDGQAEILWPASGVRLTMECSPALDHLVVFAPRAERRVDLDNPPGPLVWFCVEPQTVASDAFNLEARGIPAGVAVLEPGQSLETSVRMRIERM